VGNGEGKNIPYGKGEVFKGLTASVGRDCRIKIDGEYRGKVRLVVGAGRYEAWLKWNEGVGEKGGRG